MRTLLSLFFAASAGLHAANRWYEIRIAGQPSGYQHSTVEALEQGEMRSTDEIIIVINRLGTKVEIKTKTVSLENAAGELVSVREEVTQSQQPVITQAELKGDKILLRSTTGGNTYNRSMTLKAPVCGPAAFDRMTRDNLKNPGDQVSCRLYTPSIGVPYKATRTLLAIEDSSLRVKTELDGAPGNIIELYDREGVLIQNEREMPFGAMLVRAVDRETALRADAGAELPAESFDRTMARSNVRFADARGIERIKFKITHKKPELGWPSFDSPMQTVLEKTPSTVILEVARPERKPSSQKIDEAIYLKPNQILQSDDPEVSRLAHQIVGDTPDRYEAARKLQDWVAANMTFDLGVALTPASEAARNRHGTCMAYSVLLASMARALGIPSRIAGGFIYAYGIWGGHAWVEVLVDNQWLPLDAAAYRPGLADAARIQFGSYTGDNNLAQFVLAGMQMYGNIEVFVLDYSIDGKTIRVPDSALRYSVEGDEYRSDGLGISIRKPEGFSFAGLEAVYPDNTILRMQRDADKITVALTEAVSDSMLGKLSDGISPTSGKTVMLDRRAVTVVSSPDKTKMFLREGQSLWMITAEGADAAGLLNRVAGGWKWLSPQ